MSIKQELENLQMGLSNSIKDVEAAKQDAPFEVKEPVSVAVLSCVKALKHVERALEKC